MPRVVDKGKKQKEILEAAMAVFSRTGYRRAKVKDIADEAGVGKGTIYEYFSSKQDIFLQMAEYLFDQYVLNQVRDLDFDHPEEQLRTLAASLLEQTAMWTGLAYLTVDIWSEMDKKDQEDRLRRLMNSVLERGAEEITRYIREAQHRGVIRDIDPRLAALIIMAAFDGLTIQLMLNRDMFDLQAMADTLARVLFEGLRK